MVAIIIFQHYYIPFTLYTLTFIWILFQKTPILLMWTEAKIVLDEEFVT